MEPGFWCVWILVPILALRQIKKNPVVKRHVLAYAEHQSGQSGFLWFEEEVGTEATQWSETVADKWKLVKPPSLKMPSELKPVSLLFVCCLALMWVPVRIQQSNNMPAVVQQEFEVVQEEVVALEALVEESDPQIEAWKETLSDIEDGMSVGNTLRTLDDLSQQIEQRREEAMDAVSQAMDALEQGDTESCPNLLNLLRKQNMLPSSAQDTQSGSENNGSNSESVGDDQQNRDGGQTEGAQPK